MAVYMPRTWSDIRITSSIVYTCIEGIMTCAVALFVCGKCEMFPNILQNTIADGKADLDV